MLLILSIFLDLFGILFVVVYWIYEVFLGFLWCIIGFIWCLWLFYAGFHSVSGITLLRDSCTCTSYPMAEQLD